MSTTFINSITLANGDSVTVSVADGIVASVARTVSGVTTSVGYDSDGLFDTADRGLDPTGLTVGLGTDDADTRAWTSFETWRDDDGFRVYGAMVRDNGLNGQVVQQGGTAFASIADTADTKPWMLREVWKDETGALTADLRILDTGRIIERELDAAGRVDLIRQQDLGDQFVWAERTVFYDDAGGKDRIEIHHDDGRFIERDYIDGVLRFQVVNDAADDFRWDRIERTFDESGVLIEQVRFMDEAM